MRITNLTAPYSMIHSSNTYLVHGSGNALDDTNTLIDAGNDLDVIDHLLCTAPGLGKRALEQVILTHSHFDHAGALPYLRDYFDPVVYACSPFVGADVLLKDGQTLRYGDRTFEVIHTPGHTEDSICLYCQTDGILFAGDTPLVIRSSGGCYEDRFVCALERLCQKDVRAIYFGHGSPLTQRTRAVLAESLQNVKTAQARLRDAN